MKIVIHPHILHTTPFIFEKWIQETVGMVISFIQQKREENPYVPYRSNIHIAKYIRTIVMRIRREEGNRQRKYVIPVEDIIVRRCEKITHERDDILSQYPRNPLDNSFI